MPAAEAGLEGRASSKGVFRALQRLCLPVSFKHCQQPILIMISIYYDHCCHARSQGEWKSFFWGEWDALFNSLGEPQTQTVSKPTDQEVGWWQMSSGPSLRGENYTPFSRLSYMLQVPPLPRVVPHSSSQSTTANGQVGQGLKQSGEGHGANERWQRQKKRRQPENGRLGEGRYWRRKKKVKWGKKAFVKLKGKSPSDEVGQGIRVTGRSNW